MSKRSVLVVDDAKDILFLITHSLKRLGPDFEVNTAIDGPSALEQIRQQPFDLVITDYMMGEMTGLDVAREVRRLSPETQIILMSAYDTTQLRELVADIGLNGYIGKPFTVNHVLEVVTEALAATHPADHPTPTGEIPDDQAVYEALKTLYAKTGAHYVLLLNSQGQPVRSVGSAKPTTLSRLATFIASNFLSVTELASLMGDHTSVFKSSHYEGSNYNIYAYNINGDYFLAVVFGVRDKPGAIWFYTKQAAASLASLLGANDALSVAEETKASVAVEFDNLLGDEIVN